MPSTLVDASAVHMRRAWEAPAMTELPIGAETRSAMANAGQRTDPPPPPATPATKLGFSFEMSFPLAVRTE